MPLRTSPNLLSDELLQLLSLLVVWLHVQNSVYALFCRLILLREDSMDLEYILYPSSPRETSLRKGLEGTINFSVLTLASSQQELSYTSLAGP